MRDLPGYGDEATWGAVRYSNDPRYDSSAEDYAEGEVFRVVEEAEYRCSEIRRALATKGVKAAIEEFHKLSDIEIYV